MKVSKGWSIFVRIQTGGLQARPNFLDLFLSASKDDDSRFGVGFDGDRFLFLVLILSGRGLIVFVGLAGGWIHLLRSIRLHNFGAERFRANGCGR